MLRLFVECFGKLQQHIFDVNSESWEMRQQCVLAKKINDGEENPKRKYAMTVVAEGEYEKVFAERTDALWLHDELWEVIPSECRCVSFRALAFRRLSKMSCAAEYLMGVPRRRIQVQLYRLLMDPDWAAELRKIERCAWDAWASALFERYGGFEGPLILAALEQKAKLQKRSLSDVECMHAKNATGW